MAFLEGKLQPIDLLAALQARRQFEQTSEQRRQQELQNELMQEQLEAAEWANLKAKERPTITLPAGPGLGGMREKQFLDQQAGYISGVSPTDTFNQWQQNFRTGMTAGGGGGGGRSGGMVGGGQVAPGSYKTYDQLNNEAALQYNQAVADQAESQAKAADMAQSGYGSATRDLLAEQMINAKVGQANNAGYDDLIKGARDASRDRWSDIKAGDQMISDTRVTGNQMQNEIEATRQREGKAGNAEVGRGILHETLIQKSPTYAKKIQEDGKWGDRALSEYEKYHKMFYQLRGREPYAAEIEQFLKDKVK